MSAPRPAAPSDAEDQDFLANYDPDAFAHPSLAVDVVILTVRAGSLHVLLTPRREPPQRGRWALPGGFVAMDESLDAAARRVLHRASGRRRVHLEQLHTFGALRRDPRHRVVTVAYDALVPPHLLPDIDLQPITVDAGGRVTVSGPNGGPRHLAFDHDEIVAVSVARLRARIAETSAAFALLGNRFTLRELQDVHEAVLGTALNKDSFRRRMLAGGHLEPTGEREADVVHRPAELYRVVNEHPT